MSAVAITASAAVPPWRRASRPALTAAGPVVPLITPCSPSANGLSVSKKAFSSSSASRSLQLAGLRSTAASSAAPANAAGVARTNQAARKSAQRLLVVIVFGAYAVRDAEACIQRTSRGVSAPSTAATSRASSPIRV